MVTMKFFSKSLSAKDLLQLVEAAKNSKAKSLKIGDFEIQFDTAPEVVVQTPVQFSQASEDTSEVDAIDEAKIKEQNEAELMITDPLRYEELLMREGVSNEVQEAS